MSIQSYNAKIESRLSSLSEHSMETLYGGRTTQCKAWDGACAVAGIGTFFGPIGALIFGPTAAVCIADLIFNFSGC